MDGRKTQSAKAGNRTSHNTRNRSRPNSAGCTPPDTGNWRREVHVEDTGTPPELEFGKHTIEDWLWTDPNCELKGAVDKLICYSTTSGALLDTPALDQSEQREQGNKKTLKTENISDTLLPPLELLANYKKLVRPYNPKLNIQLQCLLNHDKVDTSTFVCQSDVLVEVGRTISCYKTTGPKIAVEKIGQTIYMYRYAYHSKDKVLRRKEWQNKNEYAGLMFEHCMTQELHTSFEPDQKFCALVKAELGGHKLIISGEVDCVDKNDDFVELKTSMHEFKAVPFPDMLKWWLQCYLLGVKTIVVGKHDEDRKCSGVKEHAVDELKEFVDVPQGNYKIFLATIHKFLTNVEQHMQGNDTITKEDRKIYLFVRNKDFSSFAVKPSADSRDQFIKEEMVKQLIAKNRPKPTATQTDSAAPPAPIGKKAI